MRPFKWLWLIGMVTPRRKYRLIMRFNSGVRPCWHAPWPLIAIGFHIWRVIAYIGIIPCAHKKPPPQNVVDSLEANQVQRHIIPQPSADDLN